MAHAQKPDFVLLRNGRVHLNRRGRQYNRLLAAEVCASAVVMLDTPCSEVVWEYWLPTPFASFPFTTPPVRHRRPSHFKWTLPIILISTLFSNTLSLRSSLNVGDQFSHPYKTTGKILVLYILIFKFLDRKLEDKRFCTKWYQSFADFNLLFFFDLNRVLIC
jgi:hypothetical protein